MVNVIYSLEYLHQSTMNSYGKLTRTEDELSLILKRGVGKVFIWKGGMMEKKKKEMGAKEKAKQHQKQKKHKIIVISEGPRYRECVRHTEGGKGKFSTTFHEELVKGKWVKRISSLLPKRRERGRSEDKNSDEGKDIGRNASRESRRGSEAVQSRN